MIIYWGTYNYPFKEKSMSHIDTIKQALEKFYQNDSSLLERQGKIEKSISVRIGHYLSEIIESENDGLFIDCEFERNGDDLKEICINGMSKKVRPDIICHDRGCLNCFIVEIKLGSPGKDLKKVPDMMAELGYSFGYVISNMKNKSRTVVIYEYKLNNLELCPDGEKHKYKYDIDNETLRELHIS